jgi:hypothetical protein
MYRFVSTRHFADLAREIKIVAFFRQVDCFVSV